MTAAATTFAAEQTRSIRVRDPFRYASWQEEAWAHYDAQGEFGFAVDWLTKALSRVRLIAAEVPPGGGKPEPVETGRAAELVADLEASQGPGGSILALFGPQISIPGEGWLVGEQAPSGPPQWTVRSTDEIRLATASRGLYEVREDEDLWRPLTPQSIVGRVWDPHPRWHWRAVSCAQRALPILRRIDLLDRRIVATLVSRLAMNGLLLIPQEGSFTTPARYAEADDPFVAMMMDVAANNMQNPGSASASIPIPVRYSKDLIDKWRHLTLNDGVTTELLEERDKELRRLATTVNVPAEVVLGMGDANHWTAWQLEESAIKLHVAPLSQLICAGMTTVYLHPLLTAESEPLTGPGGGQLICWHDTSELTTRPDRADDAFRAYDRLEIHGEALRRETGFGPEDAPDKTQLRDQVLRRLTGAIQYALYATDELTGSDLAENAPPIGLPAAGPAGGPGSTPSADPAAGPADGPGGADRRGPPQTQGEPPPPPGADAAVWPGWLPPADREPRPPAARISPPNGQPRGGT